MLLWDMDWVLHQKMIIVKNRTGVFNWGVYHESIGNTKYIRIELTLTATFKQVLLFGTTQHQIQINFI
jgi:hypothetical protein